MPIVKCSFDLHAQGVRRWLTMMTLTKFRVQNFRSIMDSGWIDCDDITSLIGINEAGKSNLILALWKLKPAREELESEINSLHDMPRHMYTQWENIPEKIEFINAGFILDNELRNKIVELSGCDLSATEIIEVTRKYDGKYVILFPGYYRTGSINVKTIIDIVENARNDIEGLNEKTKSEEGIKDKVLTVLGKISAYALGKESFTESDLKEINTMYPSNLKKSATSEIFPKFEALKSNIVKAFSALKTINPAENKNICNLIVAEMPSFVYYSNYGNLDAEIYLPHAVKLLNGEKIPGFDNIAKVRTLRVLFEFVNLDPDEILELGQDPLKQERIRTITKTIYTNQPNSPKISNEEEVVDLELNNDAIKDAERNKTARAIKLDSASSNLTKSFNEWWRQGEYIFSFDADGDYFKIWVSDRNRSSRIELHKRSTGLQWFLSFYLVFLVESREAHKGAVLLLDEAGLTLHPLAQKDLLAFFENLAEENQIIHTTHSPFLVDTNNIDRVKVVFVNKDGFTVASNNLRDGIDVSNKSSVYAAHAALGFSVSDVILQGCNPIIVEGSSDQYYLNAIKLYLIQNKKIAPEKELVFLPAGGTSTKGVQGIIGILGGKSEELPAILIDSDKNGDSLKKNLISGVYNGENAKYIISIEDITGICNSEVEDLIPYELMKNHVDKILRNDEYVDFDDFYIEREPFIPQIEIFAKNNNIELATGWKVELSKSVKMQLLKSKRRIGDNYIEKWIKLFTIFISGNN
jgi:AAA15 family ATPase/GTPase